MSSFLLVTTADIIWSPDTDVLVLSAVCKKNGIYIWFKTCLYKECDRLLTVPRRYFFCGSFMFLFCLVFAMFCARLFICALWSPAGKGLTSWLSFVVSSVSLSLSHWYPGSGMVLDCIDS